MRHSELLDVTQPPRSPCSSERCLNYFTTAISNPLTFSTNSYITTHFIPNITMANHRKLQVTSLLFPFQSLTSITRTERIIRQPRGFHARRSRDILFRHLLEDSTIRQSVNECISWEQRVNVISQSETAIENLRLYEPCSYDSDYLLPTAVLLRTRRHAECVVTQRKLRIYA